MAMLYYYSITCLALPLAIQLAFISQLDYPLMPLLALYDVTPFPPSSIITYDVAMWWGWRMLVLVRVGEQYRINRFPANTSQCVVYVCT